MAYDFCPCGVPSCSPLRGNTVGAFPEFSNIIMTLLIFPGGCTNRRGTWEPYWLIFITL